MTYDEQVFEASERPSAWSRISKGFARAASWVRRWGPYVAFAALALGFINTKQIDDRRQEEADRSVASDIISCNIGNGRLVGNINGVSEGLADVVVSVVNQAGIDLGLSDEELRTLAENMVRDAMQRQPQNQPRDCSSIPTLTLPTDSTTTTEPTP